MVNSYAKYCCPSVVTGFIYMWHPEALDAFDDYFGSISNFTNTVDDTWTTQITLTHWGLTGAGQLQLPGQYYEERNGGKFPPSAVQNLAIKERRPDMKSGVLKYSSNPLGKASFSAKLPTEEQFVGEHSSTLVITGDPTGRFWVCSLWSSFN